MDDMKQQETLGTVKNVLVKIDKFEFPCDSVVTDMPENLGEMIIFGRPFLETIHAQIDVFPEEISLVICEDRIKFDHSKLGEKAQTSESSKLRPFRPRPCDYSFDEWLKVKIGHTDIYNSDREIVFNEWILDSFDVEEAYAKEIGNPYSRRFDEYKQVLDNEVEQLSNEYTLRIGKRGMSWMMFGRNASNNIEKVSILGMTVDSKKMSYGKVEMKKLTMNHVRKMTEQDSPPPTITVMKIPIIKKGEYDIWSMRMRQYICHTGHNLWDIIVYGDLHEEPAPTRDQSGPSAPPVPKNAK
ncbi:BYPASS-related protein [Tanacetum coccineum]